LVGHLSKVEELISRGKRGFCYLLDELVISNDLSQVLIYDLEEVIG